MPSLSYFFMGIDTVIRIGAALWFLFVLIPRLALPPRPEAFVLERFWWNFGVGTITLVFIGQLLSLGNLYTLPTLLLALLLLIVAAQCIQNRESPLRLIRRIRDLAVVTAFNILDRRVNLRRRARLGLRRLRKRALSKIDSPAGASRVIGWTILTVTAAGLRFYRPFSSLDFGASDPYVHLHWLKILELGKQVDLSWGPYPRGLHFVLLAIVKLTNIDQVLLMNFFGAFIGVLITLSVADVTRRVSGSLRAGLLAGLIFATMIGGPGQYWLIGGRFDPYELPRVLDDKVVYRHNDIVFLTGKLESHFDLMSWGFVRQTVTLPQEMAVVLLFPTALFGLEYLRERRRWHLFGYAGGVATIASVHTGVLMPLSLLFIAVLVAALTSWRQELARVRVFLGTTLAAILAGMSWALVFTVYQREGGWLSYYLGEENLGLFAPFLTKILGGSSDRPGIEPTASFYASTTRAMMIVAAVSLALVVVAFFVKQKETSARLKFLAISTLLILFVQVATSFGLLGVLDPNRNCQWLMIAIACMIGTALNELLRRVLSDGKRKMGRVAASAILLLTASIWLTRVPNLGAESFKQSDWVDATEYGNAVEALLRLQARLQPLTWTLVTYGQEFPHVLGKGYHMAAAEFLENYDPNAPELLIPTQHVFILFEKNPHRHQINTWAATFSRANLEERLGAWCVFYQLTHDDMRVYLDDENIRIYVIQRTPQKARQIAKLAARKGTQR